MKKRILTVLCILLMPFVIYAQSDDALSYKIPFGKHQIDPTNILKEGINVIKVMHPNGKSASVKIIKNKSSISNKPNLDLVL